MMRTFSPQDLIVEDTHAASLPWINSLWFKFLEHHWGCLHEWERKYMSTLEVLKQTEEIKNIIDIGANTGPVSLFLSIIFDPQRIVCIEPDISNFIFLKYAGRTIETDYTKVNFVNKAIYYSDLEEMNMIGSEGNVNTGGKFLEPVLDEKIPSNNFYKDPNPVKIKTLESVCDLCNLDRADLVKIDVEGAEWNIIENSSFLKEKTNLIFLEYHDKSLEETLDFLKINLPNHDVIKHMASYVILKHNKWGE